MKEDDFFKYKSGEKKPYFKLNRAYKRKITIFCPNLHFYSGYNRYENNEFYYIHIKLGDFVLSELKDQLATFLLKNYYTVQKLGYLDSYLEKMGFYNFWTLAKGDEMLIGRGLNSLLETMSEFSGELGIVFNNSTHMIFFGAKSHGNALVDAYLDIHIFNDKAPYADTLKYFRNLKWGIEIETNEVFADYELSYHRRSTLFDNFKLEPEACLYYEKNVLEFMIIKKPDIKASFHNKFSFPYWLISHKAGFAPGEERGGKEKRIDIFQMLELPKVNLLEIEVGIPFRKGTSMPKSLLSEALNLK